MIGRTLRALRTMRGVIASHPLTRNEPTRAWLRLVWWVVLSRLMGEINLPWVDGQRLIVRRGMTGATGNVYLGLHEFMSMMLTIHFLREDDLFLDVGANVGTYTVLASGVCRATTWAFEPDAAAVHDLARNVEVNRLGGRVEIGLFGRDGFAGTALVLGSDRIQQQIFMQVGGHGHRIGADAFIRLTEASASLRALLLRYTHTFLVQTACTAHANASAPVQERLARWLLMYHDRQDGDELSITHDFLSMMLGVRRTTVTLTLQLLEGARLIQARRGRVIVLDREGLEGAAGDAYGPAEAEYERLIAPLRRRPDRPGPVPPRA